MLDGPRRPGRSPHAATTVPEHEVDDRLRATLLAEVPDDLPDRLAQVTACAREMLPLLHQLADIATAAKDELDVATVGDFDELCDAVLIASGWDAAWEAMWAIGHEVARATGATIEP